MKKLSAVAQLSVVGCQLSVALLGAAPLNGATYYVTVAGLGGEPEYEQRFSGWAKELDKLLRATDPSANVATLSGPEATKAKVEAVLRRIAQDSNKEDGLVLMLIGHGTYDGSDYKMNLPGPDMSGVDLATVLDRVPARQLIVNMTSSSGGSLAALQRENRAVITATKTGTERNATIFARYWVEALRDASADTDKSETVSALEAFRYAEQKTTKFYESNNRLATEHAVLEDTGKGQATRAPSPQNGQGLLAGRFSLLRIGAAGTAAADNPELLKRKQDLEEKIDNLKYQKAAMQVAQYRQQLTALLTELAKVQAELDK